ncbi:MAG: hypothetical protein SGJ19_18075, partial [Planctomycetia bacterium]|nr:hypothetical protein [Planctomycetia bacterium]
MKRLVDGLRTYLIAWAILSWAILSSAVRAVPAAAPSPAAADPAVAEPAVAQSIGVIARVGPSGSGSGEARAARDALAQHGAEILPPLLVAMDTRNVVAANWYRTVFDEIVLREGERDGVARLRPYWEAYAGDARRAGRPRRLALTLIERDEPGFTATWIAGRLGDPEFGYEAVAHALSTGEQALRD